MALINCPECGKEISDQSPQCIHCGYIINDSNNNQNDNSNSSTNKGNKKKLIIIIAAVVAVIALVLIIVLLSKGSTEKCKKAGCDKKVYSDGYCIDHYNEITSGESDDSSDESGDGFEEDTVETKEIKKDEKITNELCEFTLLGYSISKKIEPKNLKDVYVYTYFEASNGNQYVDVKFSIKNKQNSSVAQNEILDNVKIIYDGEYEYNCAFVTVDKDNDFQSHTSLYDISPLETLEYHMLAEVPDEVKSSDKSLVVQIVSDGVTYECKLR